jgi:hypothetical protein
VLKEVILTANGKKTRTEIYGFGFTETVMTESVIMFDSDEEATQAIFDGKIKKGYMNLYSTLALSADEGAIIRHK